MEDLFGYIWNRFEIDNLIPYVSFLGPKIQRARTREMGASGNWKYGARYIRGYIFKLAADLSPISQYIQLPGSFPHGEI